MRRFVPYLVTALAGLSLGGAAATAGGLVTGARVADGSLRLKDMSQRAREVLRGGRGPRGLQGDPGPPGPQGPVGSIALTPCASCHRANLVAAGPVAASGTEYLRVGEFGSTPTESDAQLASPGFAVLRNLHARVAQPSSGTRRFRIRLNGSDAVPAYSEELTCSIPPGELRCTAAPNGLAVQQADRIAVQVESAGATASTASMVFEFGTF